MKCLKGMKQKNKWMILLAGAFVCAVAGFTHTSNLAAAEADEQDLMTMDYLDPFDLTVTSYSVSAAPAGEAMLSTEMDTAVAAAPTSAYSQPLKVWIPYRPTFRSPCMPSW